MKKPIVWTNHEYGNGTFAFVGMFKLTVAYSSLSVSTDPNKYVVTVGGKRLKKQCDSLQSGQAYAIRVLRTWLHKALEVIHEHSEED